ncbi:MAG: hypothetical protein A3K10_09860 [Bacteroidetes bacterium RIFCSPLOWO2_12_FULL_31_6]|nr:MAG: hypothetical protein A3K10_09860 [Bacteroidetes bacterium RIFCSPLOWO2_12_FULL_31_6]
MSNNNFQNESVTEENLSSLQASRFLKIKLSTLYSKVAKGELSYSRSGGRKLLFSRKMLEEYVLKRKVKSMDEIKTEAENYINKKYHGGN